MTASIVNRYAGAAARRVATVEDVFFAYHVLLGRNPENEEIVSAQAGRALDDTCIGFVVSEEFATMAADVLRTEHLPHADRLSEQDRERAAVWIAETLDLPIPIDGCNWWLLLHLLMGLVDRLPVEAQEFAALVASRTDATVGMLARMLPLVTLDTDWFLRLYPNARLAIETGAYADASSYFLENGLGRDGLQLLPAFSDGLQEVYRKLDREDATISTVMAATIQAARSGAVSHWLFARDYYQGVLAWQQDGETRHEPDVDRPSPYLDFLTYGDRKDYAPHPLFCAYAYRTLNGNMAADQRRCFWHYITTGCFSERRTSGLFEPAFYLASNPAARNALLTGTHVSALHHFLTVGVRQDAAFSPDFDIHHYHATCPDVVEAVRNGIVPSVTWHFLYQGLLEGRAPNPYFNVHYYRMRYPEVMREMQRLGIRSELEHFLLIGSGRGYKADRPLVSTSPALDVAKAVFQRRARRSYNTVVRAPFDFSPFVGERPEVSIVVPVFDEVEFTSRFLECAYFAASHFFHMSGKGCEVVVVDNGSRDRTPAVLAACKGLRVVTFDGPIGFPRAVNAGAEASVGDIVIVANNDIEFAPDAVLKVWRRLSDGSDIGILGGLTILPNETLQEAGSFLDQHANVIGLGRGENPWDQYFQGVHAADYCTGNFISFRRADFDALGGLDEAFSPGYYEETDFTLRMLEVLGKRACVDGDIQISHFEHASFGKGRPPATAHALIKKNQARFAGKHRESLASKPVTLRLMTDQGAPPHVIGRTRFLIVEDMIPDSRLGSGFVRSSWLMAELSRMGVPFDLLVLNPSLIVDDYADPRVTVYRAWMAGEDFATVLGRAARYSHVLICRTHNLARLATILEPMRHRHGFQVICDTEALSIVRVLETKRLTGGVVTEEDQSDAIRLELESPVEVAQWIAVNPFEKQQIESNGFGPVTIVSHRFDPPPARPSRPWSQRTRMIAVGAVYAAGAPNHDALLWFMDRIYPRLVDRMADLTLTIVGFWNADVLRNFRDRYAKVPMEFTGVVSNRRLSELYDESRMALAPTRFAAGVACKVLETMTLGVPIVITDLLERQIVGDGEAALAVGRRDDDGRSFADWVARLANDEAAWLRIRDAQFDAARPLASTEGFTGGVRQMLATAGVQIAE